MENWLAENKNCNEVIRLQIERLYCGGLPKQAGVMSNA